MAKQLKKRGGKRKGAGRKKTGIITKVLSLRVRLSHFDQIKQAAKNEAQRLIETDKNK